MELDVAAEIGVDLATKKDIQRWMRQHERKFSRKILAGFSAISDGTGKVAFRVYDIPDGYMFTLAKFIAWGDAHTPNTGNVYTNAAAWGGLFHGAASPVNLADFFPYPEAATGQVLPYTREYNKFNGPEWRAPDNVFFQLIGGPVTENITCLIFGELEAISKTAKMKEFERMRRNALDFE